MKRVDDLVDRIALETCIGPIRTVRRSSMPTDGFSGAEFERLTVEMGSGAQRDYIVKRVRPSIDWTAYRTGDSVGREGRLPAEPDLASVWLAFARPYVAYAFDPDRVGLLMHDLTRGLRPDVNAPLKREEEDAALRALASMHGRFWEADALQLPWLATFAQRLNILHPGAPGQEARRGHPHPVFERVQRGWQVALDRLPASVADTLLLPPNQRAQMGQGMPFTLLHGDPKIGNLSFLEGGRVAAFDWAVVGTGPATMDLAHYLAINGSRLTRTRDEVIAHYRSLLEAALDEPLPDGEWQRLLGVGIMGAAGVLLWTKGAALEADRPGAEDEWRWWERQLQEYLYP